MCCVDQAHRELRMALYNYGDQVLPKSFKEKLKARIKDLEEFKEEVQQSCYQVRDSQKKRR